MGPQASKSYPGRRPVRSDASPAERATQEIDYGRRGPAGYVFGAFRPAAGAALTATYGRRTLGNWVDFLGKVEGWIEAGVERVYAVLDNLNVHTACDALLFSLAHPRWEFVFQPKYAACLNLIEPWWKVLRSLALEGGRFESWAEIEAAVERATAYRNEHEHPFVWGRRRRPAVLERDERLGRFVRERLLEGWTPEQIAGWLKRGEERGLRLVSTETVYAFVHRAGQKAEKLRRLLPRGRCQARPPPGSS